MQRITKLKVDGAKVELHYEVEREGDKDPDVYTLKTVDEPLATFAEALADLAPHVCRHCELPPEYVNGMTVRGVSFSWTHEIMGAVVTVLKQVATADAPLVLNSPHAPEEPYSDSGGPCLAPAFVTALSRVITEAERYLNGERAQGALFAGAAPEGEKAEIAGAAAAAGAGDRCVKCGASGRTLIELSAICDKCFDKLPAAVAAEAAR